MPELSKGRLVRDSQKVVDLSRGRTVRPHEEIYRDVKGADPARIAEATKTARALGTDPLEVYEFPEDARHAVGQPDFNVVRAQAPTLAKATEKTNFMALVQQDIDNLAKLEAATRDRPKLTVGRLIGSTWETMRAQMSQFAEVDATSFEATDAEDMTAFQAMVENGSMATQEEYSKFAYEAQGQEYKPGMKRNVGYQREAFEGFLKQRHEAARKTADKYTLPEEYEDTSGDIESTLKALAGSSAGMLGGPGMMFAQIKGASIQGLRAEGITDAQILADASTIEALGSTPLESAGTVLELVILSKLPGGATMLKKMLGRFVKTNKGRKALIKAMRTKGIAATEAIILGAGTEGMEEYLQAYPGEYARQLALNPDADSDEVLSKFFDEVTTAEFQEQAGEAARIGAMAGGTLIGGGAAISSVMDKRRKKMVAEQTALMIEAQKELAKEVELLRSEPTTFTDYLRKVEEETGDGKFYLQADSMITALQEAGIDPVEWADQYGVGPVELTEALQMGEGMVALDSASVIAGLAQGEDVALATLQDKLLAAPEDFSASQVDEAANQEESAQERLQELYEEEKTRTVSRTEVLELEQALTETGTYTAAQARDMSLLMGARANTWARKTGRDAAEWFKRWGVEIREGVYLQEYEDLSTKLFTHDEMMFFPHESDISSEKPGAPIYDETGEQVARTPSLQPSWYTNNQYKTSYSTKNAAKLIKKAREGAELTETQELFVREAVRINKEELTDSYSQSMGVFAWLKSQGYQMSEAIDIIDAFVADPQKTFAYGEGELSAKEIQSEYASGITFFQADIDTAEFEAWAGEGYTLIDSDEINDFDFMRAKGPFVVRVFHGTTHEFEAFEADRGNIEGQFGRVNYFTSSYDDAKTNYAGEGPDLTNTLAIRAEQLKDTAAFSDPELKARLSEMAGKPWDDMSYADKYNQALEVAREQLSGGGENILEVFVRMENPFAIGDNAWVELYDYEGIEALAIAKVADGNDIGVEEVEENRDDYEDEIDEARYEIEDEEPNPLTEALLNVAPRYGVSPAEVLSEVQGLAESATPEQIEALLRGHEELVYTEDEEGKLAGYQIVADVIEEMGYDSIILKNAEERFSTMDVGYGVSHVHVFDANRTNIKSVENTGAFSATDPRILHQESKAPRGQVEFRTGRTTVTLFENANLSTMLHETGHIFLEDLKETAELDGVEVEQWEAVKTWLGVEDGKEITSEQHEKFARTFEAYLREGQAPSIELRGAFESFRKWLVNIYRSIMQLDVQVNDDLRGIFDAMLATEDQIAEAQALAAQTALLDETYMREAGATQDDIDEYKRSVRASGAQADRDGFKHKVVGRDERRRAWRKQAKEEADAMPVFALIEQVKETGLDPADLEATYGKKVRKAIPNNLKRTDGITADQAAARFDYGSGRAVVEDIQASPSKTKWVAERVESLDQEFNARWDAEEAIHNRLARDLFEEESLKLAQKLQRKALSRKALRRWAEETTAAQTAGEAANVYKLIAQSRKLRKKAIAAQKAGKDVEAFDLNEKVRMTEELIAVRYKVRDELQKAERRWKRTAKRSLPPRKGAFNYDERHMGQVRKMLTRYQLLGKKALPFPDVRLADFFNEILAEEQDTREDVITSMGEGAGFATFLFDENDARNWKKQLTLAEVREVDNLIKALMKDGRLDKKDLLSDGTSLKATAEGLAEPMVGMKPTRNKDETAILSRLTRKWRKFMAEHVPLQYILMRADGFKSGINIARLFNSITERVDDQHRLVKRVNEALSPALEHFKARSQDFPEVLTHVPIFDQFKTAQPSLVWTFDKVMAVALNMGNVDNAGKLMGGYTIDGEAITVDNLLDITSILDARDWEMVQKIWDGINIMWTPTVEMHERLKGYSPQKVKGNPLTVTTADGQTVNLDGGYYPLKFDTRLNTDESDLSAKQAEFEDLKQHQEALFPSVAPKAGQTMARKATAGGRQVELGMGVLARHIDHASMYATMADVLNDVDRITMQAEWKKSFKTAFGDTLYDMIRPALATVANPRAGKATMSSTDNVIEWLRARTAPIILFFNLRVAVKQPFSIFNLYQSMRANGNALSNIGKGYKRAMKDPVGLYGEVHNLSAYMERRADAIDRELQKGLKTGEYRKKTKKQKAFDAVQDWGDEWGPIFIRLGDFAAAYPGWWASYEQGLQMFNGDLGKAVHHADNHIRSTQPSFAPVDTAQLQRSNAGMARLFTMFTGYTMKYANRRHFYWEGFKKGEISGRDFAFHVALERIAPSLTMTSMLTLLTRGVPEDDEEWQMFVEDALLDLLLFQMAGRVGIQEIAAVAGLTKYKRGGTFKTPLSAIPDAVQRRMSKVTNAIESGDEDEIMEALFWFMLTAGEVATKIPLAQRGSKLQRNIEEYEDDERTAPGVLF